MNEVVTSKTGVRFLKDKEGLYEIIELDELLSGPVSHFTFLKGSEDRYRAELNGKYFIFHKYPLFAKSFSYRFNNFSASTEQPAAYFIVCATENVFYIGSSGGVYRRLINHRAMCRHDKHFRPELAQSYAKHGKGNLHALVIYQDTKEQALLLEQELYDAFKDDPRKLNIGTNAELPSLGTKYSSDQLVDRSALSKHIWSDPERRKRMSENRKKHFSSPEVRQKQSDKLKAYFAQPGAKEASSVAGLARFAKPGEKQAQSKRIKAYFEQPGAKEAQRSAQAHRSHSLLIEGVMYAGFNAAARALSIDPALVYQRVKSLLPKWQAWQRVPNSSN